MSARGLCSTCFGAGCRRCGLPVAAAESGRRGGLARARIAAVDGHGTTLPANPPPRVTPERWQRLLLAAAHADAVVNRGAGPARGAE